MSRYKFPEPKPSPEKQREIHASEERMIAFLEAYIEKHGNQPYKQIT